ncbi:hypothetical protein K9N50_13225, partial [bacterium]|nr:hypothetical protein [bacterium]
MQKVALLALALLFTITAPLTALTNDMTSLPCPVAVLSSSQESTVVSFSTEQNNSVSAVKLEQVVENNQTFDHYTIEGEGFTFEYGKPQLPCISRFVIVPPDKGLELVVDAGQVSRIQAENTPLICLAEDLAETAARDALENQDIYPSKIAEMSEPLIMRGVRMVRIDTYPVQYDPSENVYLCHDNIKTEIRYTNEIPINPVDQPIRRNRSPEFMKFLRSFAINSDIIGRDDPEDDEPDYVGHYLVVTHERCLEYAAEFIEWRRKSGWKVDILSLSSGDAGNPGRVRGYMRDRYREYTEAGLAPFDMVMLIGDHTSYDNLAPNPGWTLASDAGRSVWPHNCNHNDYYYAELEGDDHYADVGIARWIAGSEATLELFSARTLSYEVTPDMEETDWFTRGFVYAQRWGGNYHVSLATNVRWGKSVLESLGFDDVETYENMDTHDSGGDYIGPHIEDAFDNRTNVMIGRAENYHWRYDIYGMEETGVYPIDLDVGGHHEWTCWNMLRMPVNSNDLMGPVAASTGWGGQETLPYSIIWLESVNGFLQHDMTFGWAHIKGVLSPEIYIPGQEDNYWEECRTDVVFYGDPAIQYWRGVPTVVELEYTSTIAPTDKLVSVYVLDAENETDLEGAQVSIYVQGDMPAPDSDDYADYDDMFMMTKKTNAEGLAVFVIPDNVEFEEGTMYLTVTGRNILPNLNEIEIVEPEAGIELTGWSLDQDTGNDDDYVNPGEVFFVDLTVRNLNQNEALNNVTATVTGLSPYLEVSDENTVDFGDINGGESAESRDGVLFSVSMNCPDGASRPSTKPSLKIIFHDEDNNKVGETAIQFDPVAPDFVVRNIVDGSIIADSLDYVNPLIENIGRMAASQATATMVSLGMGVSVVENEANYPELEPNESSALNGNGFRVAGNRVVVPGSSYDVALVFETEDGFIDSAFFRLQVMEARENAPQGPDGYGYICFDDTDTDWDIAPDYDWLEISTEERDPDFEGNELDLNTNDEIGETIVIDLPFETQFYGRIYDQITIATNGFISMGDQEYVTNYQNWPMDRAVGGGVGMMAPFWDDLRFGDGGGVYTYYDEQESQFIIEWYKMHQRSGGNGNLTFQIIIYDHEVWITETGDQNILFQYKEINNVTGRAAGWANASPFASVGISSPEGTTGINYTFNNVYPVTSAELEARRALLFATSPRYRSGALFGRVTDARTNLPIEEAVVSTLHGFTALTDEDGFWRINDALADITFSITCMKPGYNDSTKYDLMVEEDGELEINFNLLHPEFTPSTMAITLYLDPGLTSNMPFSVENTGNGPLDWTLARKLPGNADVDPWEFRMSYAISDSVADARVEGV